MQHILITGGTGLVGKKLTRRLQENGYIVHIFSRHARPAASNETVRYFKWDPVAQTYDPNALERVIAVINLAGAGIAEKRWTAKRKKEILNSRVQSGITISKALRETPHSVTVLVQASAIGWYKHEMDAEPRAIRFQEDWPAGDDFLGQTCKAWESSIQLPGNSHIRVVTIRIGIVLSASGGMVKEILKPIRWGFIPVFGNGKQIVPWIHIDDLNEIFLMAIEKENMNGVFNAVAPGPVSQKKLAVKIANLAGKNHPIPLPIPAFLLQWLLGALSVELLKSSEIFCDKIIQEGFSYRYPELQTITHL